MLENDLSELSQDLRPKKIFSDKFIDRFKGTSFSRYKILKEMTIRCKFLISILNILVILKFE